MLRSFCGISEGIDIVLRVFGRRRREGTEGETRTEREGGKDKIDTTTIIRKLLLLCLSKDFVLFFKLPFIEIFDLFTA